MIRPAERSANPAPAVRLMAPEEPVVATRSDCLTPFEKQFRLASLAPNAELAARAWELVQGPPASGLDLFCAMLHLNGYEAGLVPNGPAGRPLGRSSRGPAGRDRTGDGRAGRPGRQGVLVVGGVSIRKRT